MSTALKIDRRAFLQGAGGASLALPVLDAMGAEAIAEPPRRFCALYTANGMSLPRAENGLDEWSWFPAAEREGQFVFGRSTEPLSPFRKQLSFVGGLYHPSGPKADPHTCSDMWLTGAPQSEAGNLQHRRARPGRCLAHQAALPAAVARAVDRRRDRLPLSDGHDFLQLGRQADPG